MSAPALTVGVDLGGTSLRVGLVAADGEVVASVRAATDPGGVEVVYDQIVAAVGDVAGERWDEVVGVGVGVPAAVSPATGAAALAPNIPGLAGRRPAADLQARLGRPVVVDNDVAVALLGEHAHGAAQGYDDVVLLSLGTGVGAAVLGGGRLLRGHRGAAGEVADLPVPSTAAGRDRAWFEAHVGTPALARLAGSGGWTVPQLCDAAGEGDATAERLLASWADEVARGLMAVVAVVDPALAVLGGGIGRRDPVVAAITSSLDALTSRAPRIVAGALGDWAGVVGAATQAVPLAAAGDGPADRQERA